MIDFLNSNSGAIQAIFTGILVLVTGYYAYHVHKSVRIQSLQPHSERLEKEISPWLVNISTFILNPANLPDLEEHLRYLKIGKPPAYAEQHFKTGYKEIFQKYTQWEEKTKEHDKQFKEFIRELGEKAKKEIKLPSCDPSYKPPCAYYQRIIAYTLRKILTDLPDGEPIVSIIYKSNSELRGLGNEEFFELTWSGGRLVMEGDMISEAVARDFIKRLRSSFKIIERIRRFYEETEILTKQSEELREKIKTKIVDKLKVGGLIKGKCDACY